MASKPAPTMTVEPASADINVPHPDGTYLKPGPQQVPRTAWYYRRLRDGDLKRVVASATKAKRASSSQPTTAAGSETGKAQE